MSRGTIKYSIIASVAVSAVFVFIDTRVTAGILLGSIFSYFYLYLLHSSYRNLANKDISKKSMFFKVSLRMIVLMIPLLIASLLPNIFNVFGVFAGLVMFKVVLYFEAFIKRKK